MIKWLKILFLSLFLAGCVKETEWPLQDHEPDYIVVDAIITDEAGSQTVRITMPVGELNALPEPVQGANIVISDGDSTWQLSEDSLNPGYYRTSSSFIAKIGKTYTLIIYLNGNIFSAKTYMVAGAVFNELTYVKNAGDSLYRIDWVASAFSYDDPAMWEILIDWSMVPGYEHAPAGSTRARMLFYTLPTLDVSEIYAPEAEKITFPAGTVITERRYSLNPDHAAFIREMMLETNWTGGLFCVPNSDVSTNLSNGAAGYFGACAVTSLSLTVQ